MPPHLLNLPIELLERILAPLCHEDAQSIQACRTLNTIIAQSRLVQYLERVAFLGLYGPLIPVGGGVGSATLALPDRAAALRAWEECACGLVMMVMQEVFGKSARPTCVLRYPL
jgi:hypothetical protein